MSLPPLNQFSWLISAVVAWVIFLLLADWPRLKYTVWGGLLTASFQLVVDTGAMRLNLYQVESILKLLGSPVFFTFGVVFTMGVLIAQSLPEARSLQALNILVLTALFSMLEILFVKAGVLHYLNWNHAASVFIDLLVLTGYTWLVDSLGLNRAVGGKKGGYRL